MPKFQQERLVVLVVVAAPALEEILLAHYASAIISTATIQKKTLISDYHDSDFANLILTQHTTCINNSISHQAQLWHTFIVIVSLKSVRSHFLTSLSVNSDGGSDSSIYLVFPSMIHKLNCLLHDTCTSNFATPLSTANKNQTRWLSKTQISNFISCSIHNTARSRAKPRLVPFPQRPTAIHKFQPAQVGFAQSQQNNVIKLNSSKYTF